MIEIFRSRLAKQVAVVVFAGLMVIFLLTSVDLTAFGGAGSVGKINGRSVPVRDYETLVQQQTTAAQQQSATPLSLEDVNSIRDQVWEQLIQSSVLEQEYKRYGLTATDEEVAMILQQSPPQGLQQAPEFQTEGQFDLAKYQRWLMAPTSAPYVEAFGEQVREQILRSKLLTIVTADVFLSDAALWERYRDQNETARIGLTAFVPRNLVPDSAVTVTDAEAEAWFRDHREDYVRGRVAFLSGIALPRRITAADTAAALERARAARQEILDGAPFGEIARRESADEVSAEQDGSLGQWVRGQFDPAFDSAAFSLPLNTLSEPVLSSFGYHLIEVTERRGDTASARHILVPVELAGERRDAFDARLDTLDMFAGLFEPGSLDSAAGLLGLPVVAAAPVEEGGRVQFGRQLVPDAGVWAFQASVGETSDVIETADAFYLFRLDSLRDDREPTLAQVREAVLADVRNEKKFAVARGIAEDYLRRVREGSPPATAAAAVGAAHTEVGPFPRITPPLDIPQVVGAAFSVPAGERSGILQSEDGIYVIEVLERTPADSAAFVQGLDEFRAQAVTQVRESRVRNYLAALREQADVADRRDEYLREAARFNATQAAQQL